MAVTFTQEQQEAIDLRGCNILVSAAAGSGKTAVLTERIVKMVCEGGVDIDRLLVVTFTSAAAAEMRERIAAGISKRLSAQPESEHIQRQSTLLHNAQITTIDSFCLFLLRNHFNEIGLDPAFRIADEGEIKLMQQEVLKELMEDFYASGSQEFRYCVEYFCPGGRESVLEQHILNLSRYAASFPWPARWLEARKEDYSGETVEELCDSPCGVYLTGYLHRIIQGCVDKLSAVRSSRVARAAVSSLSTTCLGIWQVFDRISSISALSTVCTVRSACTAVGFVSSISSAFPASRPVPSDCRAAFSADAACSGGITASSAEPVRFGCAIAVSAEPARSVRSAAAVCPCGCILR